MAAGKSSLLDIISGRRFGEGVEGRLRVDGVEMEAQHVRAMAGYVHQVPPRAPCPHLLRTDPQSSNDAPLRATCQRGLCSHGPVTPVMTR